MTSTMDLKAFSDDNFDSIEWINGAFRTLAVPDQREAYASEIVSRLQLFIQEINRSLEESAQNVILSLNKVHREVISVEERAKRMRNDLLQLQTKVDQLHADNNSNPAVDRLAYLDQLQTRMRHACDQLKEADNWNSLTMDLENVFNTGNVEQIFEKLLCMQRSLQMSFHDNNGDGGGGGGGVDNSNNDQRWRDRKDQLNSLKSRFEAMLATQTAGLLFSSGMSPELRYLVRMYRELELQASFVQLFRQYLADNVEAEWNRLQRADLFNNIVDSFNSLLDHVLTVCVQHLEGSLAELYQNQACAARIAAHTLIDSLVQVFNAIEPNLSQCLLQEVNKQQINNLTKFKIMSAIRSILDRFLRNFENIFTDERSQLDFTNLRKTLFMPYCRLLDLLEQIDNSLLTEEGNEMLQNFQLAEFVGKTFHAVRESERRCHQLTHLLRLPATLPNVQRLLNQMLDHFGDCLQKVTDQCQPTNQTAMANWSLFQLSLLYLQTVGEFILQLNCYQQHLVDALRSLQMELSGSICAGNENSPAKLDLCWLNESQRTELDQLITFVTSSEGNVLSEVHAKCRQLCCDCAEAVFRVACAFIHGQLATMEKSFNEWMIRVVPTLNDQEEEEDIPLFSLSPQEYITQIGQYLLTIPQHIEPFTLHENLALKHAFQQYLHCGEAQPSPPSPFPDSVAQFFLQQLSTRITDAYLQKIQSLTLITKRARLQLITDISYLCEIDDDLGIDEDNRLTNLLQSLKVDDSLKES